MDEMMRSREGFDELEALRRECEGGKEGGEEEEDTYGMLRKLVQLQRMTGGQQVRRRASQHRVWVGACAASSTAVSTS